MARGTPCESSSTVSRSGHRVASDPATHVVDLLLRERDGERTDRALVIGPRARRTSFGHESPSRRCPTSSSLALGVTRTLLVVVLRRPGVFHLRLVSVRSWKALLKPAAPSVGVRSSRWRSRPRRRSAYGPPSRWSTTSSAGHGGASPRLSWTHRANSHVPDPPGVQAGQVGNLGQQPDRIGLQRAGCSSAGAAARRSAGRRRTAWDR